jgi:8-amino-7-oxononanoate synthase
MDAVVDAELFRRKEYNQLRELRPLLPLDGPVVRADGRDLVNFCSNDYLGLSRHPLLIQRSIQYLNTYGAGATASRLICGNHEGVAAIEEKLARLKQTEAALILSSGFQANATVLPALADRRALILSDRLNHNSLIQGCRLSRCRTEVYRHNDMDHLAGLLKENRNAGFSRILVVTESVFSMDGDTCDMDALENLADQYDAFLVVDEAHATGVWGRQGMGLTCGRRVDLTIGTFGKAAGGFGAYAACCRKLKEYLVNGCAGFIYTTALPPAVIGAIDAALDLMPGMDAQREILHDHARYLRDALADMGYDTGASNTQIIPVILGREVDALDLAAWLAQNHILVIAIRPPTVPKGASRIRISLSALHTRAHIDNLIKAIVTWRKSRHGRNPD